MKSRGKNIRVPLTVLSIEQDFKMLNLIKIFSKVKDYFDLLKPSSKEQRNKVESCTHGVVFDLENVKRLSLSSRDIKTLYPRLSGVCPLGCGYNGIAYASYEHFVYGDW